MHESLFNPIRPCWKCISAGTSLNENACFHSAFAILCLCFFSASCIIIIMILGTWMDENDFISFVWDFDSQFNLSWTPCSSQVGGCWGSQNMSNRTSWVSKAFLPVKEMVSGYLRENYPFMERTCSLDRLSRRAFTSKNTRRRCWAIFPSTPHPLRPWESFPRF